MDIIYYTSYGKMVSDYRKISLNDTTRDWPGSHSYMQTLHFLNHISHCAIATRHTHMTFICIPNVDKAPTKYSLQVQVFNKVAHSV